MRWIGGRQLQPCAIRLAFLNGFALDFGERLTRQKAWVRRRGRRVDLTAWSGSHAGKPARAALLRKPLPAQKIGP